jgi:hypothetical protein
MTLPRVRDNTPRAGGLLFWKLARENSELMDIRRIACAGMRTLFDEVTRSRRFSHRRRIAASASIDSSYRIHGKLVFHINTSL